VSRSAGSTPRLVLTSVVVAAGVLAVAPASAVAADTVTLSVRSNPVAYGHKVVLSGTVSPAVAGETVGVYAEDGDTAVLVANAVTDAAGTFSVSTTVTAPETFVARGADTAGEPVESAPVPVLVRPRLVASVHGSRQVGGHLYLVGRVVPRAAGTVTVSDGDHRRTVAVGPSGRFHANLTTTRLYSYRATVRVTPADGYVGQRRTYPVRVTLLPLTIGSTGPSVWWLQYSLQQLDHYALPGIDGRYGYSTSDAVLAFQKVHGLPRTGSVDVRFWTILRGSGPPLARIRWGDHIEVDKTRQVLFEVRDGKVVSVSHVSTGATGNTPIGHWHVYAKEAGFTPKGMYDSLFFIGAFALHGYPSVPAFPASHGCVRLPMWFASGLFSRWGIGTSVYIFP
jgi:L,D-transpeptidase catalytic domain/Putative peptidoglycan binding domain